MCRVCSALTKVSPNEIQTETAEPTPRAVHVPVGIDVSGRWRDVLVFSIWVLVFTVLGWVILLMI
jgi:hypothetical protein